MSRILITLLGTGALALLTACGDDTPTEPTPPKVGLLAYGRVCCEAQIPIGEVAIGWACHTCSTELWLGDFTYPKADGSYRVECYDPGKHVGHLVGCDALYLDKKGVFCDPSTWKDFPRPPIKHDFHLYLR